MNSHRIFAVVTTGAIETRRTFLSLGSAQEYFKFVNQTLHEDAKKLVQVGLIEITEVDMTHTVI